MSWASPNVLEDVDAGGVPRLKLPSHLVSLLERGCDVVAFVLEEAFGGVMGKREGGVFGEEESGWESVTGSVERRGFFGSRGYEFGEGFRIHETAPESAGADFAAFFEDVDILGGEWGLGAGLVVFFDEIGEMQGAGKAGGPCPDDEDVGFELFALDGHGLINLSKALGFLAEPLEFVLCYVLCLNCG